MDRTKKAWINALFLAVTLAINTLGALGIINGLSQKEISDMYLTLITPGPATFSIWSVIYSLIIISIIAMIVKKNDSYYQQAVDEITGLFRISCILNILWIVSFSYVLVELSLLFIFAFVISLALLGRKLLKIQEKKRWLLPLTFGFYTGWLFIATVVNTAAALVKLEWNGFGISQETWAVIILIVAIVLVFAVLLKLRNAVFPLPVAWAYFGIYQFLSMPEGFNGAYPLVQTVALAGMAVLIGLSAIQLYRNRFELLGR
ncbi:tryptophan-rich sensory protein [Alkalibacter rhizosphaerae]|uniref:Tryptophan-rich sensory protein n=1 Tax=Alkalibacter rhizosphaerae TaxID=2815577 RepID=A0A974XGS7_9FIRM|nr:tryptophan-rich sensory protein [Alkalibacter rhizosphaerae]QSX08430.1 tryptophan-rich sensory protein [Alkalibacter rhizosphaerae]